MKPNPPHKHHYLPEFYTRRWTSETDGKMIRFWRKPNGEIERRRVTPGGIGFQDHLYTIPEQEDKRVAYSVEEGLFRQVDNHGSSCLEALIEGKIPTTDRERSRWAAFMLSLAFRTPKDLSASKVAFSLIAKDVFPNSSWNDVAAEQLAKQNLWRAIDNKKIGHVIINMEWDVLRLHESDVKAMTSDNPIVMSNGLKPPDGNYSLALSPNDIFICSWPGPARQRALSMSPKRLAKIYNRCLVERAREYVIADSERSRTFVEKHFAKDQVMSPVELIVEQYRAGQIAMDQS